MYVSTLKCSASFALPLYQNALVDFERKKTFLHTTTHSHTHIYSDSCFMGEVGKKKPSLHKSHEL